MIVSWNWLKDYVPLDMSVAELERRLMMAGLNHERTEEIDGDLAIDLEVTSNRPDCLGHLGIAREVAVLWQRTLALPAADPPQKRVTAGELIDVRIDCPDLCRRYTARVIQGVRVGPSPDWMARRLETLGITPINNIVDISNYVMMECGQPLHTFDFAKLHGREIIVRRPRPGETIEAIDHKTYNLGPEMCVIADGRLAVAIGGVMGGAKTEISSRTTAVLVEAAEFDPVSIRNTARQLNLHSDSSYRFERKVDPEGIDWASRRCCQLILDLAGGELAAGVVDVGCPLPPRKPVALRYARLPRVLGIEVAPERVRAILAALGCVEVEAAAAQLTVVPPSWRRDLTREIDLIEEVARIHGYEQIPEDVLVPMAPSVRSREDRVIAKIRHVLTACGFDESLTLSAVDEATSAAFSPWTDAEPLVSCTPVLRSADRLRRSLVPSLLNVRRTNQSLANPDIELFEIAKVYLPNVSPRPSAGEGPGVREDVSPRPSAGEGPGVRGSHLPDEEPMIALTSGRDYAIIRGAVEAIVEALNPALRLEAVNVDIPLLDPGQSCQLRLGGEVFGYLGQLRGEALKAFDLRGASVVAELRLSLLVKLANLVPRSEPLPPYPAVDRDLNLVVDESVRWADVAATVEETAQPYFDALAYRDTYRNAERLGPAKKSLLMTLTLRSADGTLTNQEADAVREAIVAACAAKFGAQLRA
jgi:phenylalanyl-tRNA synthetase beta chain